MILGQIAILLTLIQWLHSIESSRTDSLKHRSVKNYLDWLIKHNHNDLVDQLEKSQEILDNIDRMISENFKDLYLMSERILENIQYDNKLLLRNILSLKSDISHVATKDDVCKLLEDAEKIMSKNMERLKRPLRKDMLQYDFLHEKLTDFVILEDDFHVLDASGKITIKRIMETHKKIFPEEYGWRGIMREIDVTVCGLRGSCRADSDVEKAEVKINTTSFRKIPFVLNGLCVSWNKKVKKLSDQPVEKKVNGLSQFHYDFETIHPFRDGNGKVGRIILSRQASYLFQRKIRMQFNRNKYYDAFLLANCGNRQALDDLIATEIERDMRFEGRE